MNIVINGLAAIAVLTAAPALAKAEPSIPAPAPAAAAASNLTAQNKRYCIVQSMTGSRLPKKICKTRDQWMTDDGFDPLTLRK